MSQVSQNLSLNSSKATPAMLGTVQVITAAICWGTLGVFTTYLNQLGFNSIQIAILRIVTAALMMLIMLPSLWQHLVKLRWADMLQLGLQSLIGVLGMTVCYFLAVNYVGAGIAVSLLYTAPVFSLALAAVLLKEHITLNAIILAVVAVIGVAMTMMGNTLVLGLGVVFGLLSGVCYALYGILGKKAMQNNYPPQLVFFSSVVISALGLLCLPLTYQTYQQAISLPNQVWLWIIGLSLVGTIIPFFLYMTALHKLPATKASVFTIFEPFTAIVLSVFLLYQPLNGVQYIGMGLILLAAVLNAVKTSA